VTTEPNASVAEGVPPTRILKKSSFVVQKGLLRHLCHVRETEFVSNGVTEAAVDILLIEMRAGHAETTGEGLNNR